MKKSVIPIRYLLVINTFILSLLLYIDRACISAAKAPIAQEYGFSDTQMGWILSAFALGYALFQTPAGFLADKFGPRKILAIISTLWSVFTALTASAWNFLSMLVIRFLFGATEAGAFPAISRAVFSWFPLKERGLVTGINFSGSRVGAAFALPVIAWLINTYGWKSAFLLLGIIGIIWAVLWYFWFTDDPRDHKQISEEEKTFIVANRQQLNPEELQSTLTPQKLFRSRNMWLAMLQYFGSNFTFFFTLTWLFPHLQVRYGLDIMQAGLYASLPLLGGAIGNWTSGWMVDKIYKRGQWKLSRRLPAVIGFFLVFAGLVSSLYMNGANGAIICLTLAIFGADMTLSPSWSFCVDIGKRHAGTVSGTMNMAGNLGSFVTALAFPYLALWSDSESVFFLVGAFLALLSAAAWFFMNPDKPIIKRLPE